MDTKIVVMIGILAVLVVIGLGDWRPQRNKPRDDRAALDDLACLKAKIAYETYFAAAERGDRGSSVYGSRTIAAANACMDAVDHGVVTHACTAALGKYGSAADALRGTLADAAAFVVARGYQSEAAPLWSNCRKP